jgi:regulator of protease activity HflC (stomatin/prohibitin superfamily)
MTGKLLPLLVFVGAALAAYYALSKSGVGGRRVPTRNGGYAAAALVLAGVLFVTSVVEVPGGRADVITFGGAYTDGLLMPGFNFKAPWFGTYPVDISTRALHVENSDARSSDQQQVLTNYTLNFALQPKRLKELLTTYAGDNVTDRIVQPRAEALLKQIEPDYSAAQLLQKRGEVADRVEQQLKAELEPFGVTVIGFLITNINFGEQYQKASEARATAEQELQRAQVVLKTKQVEAEQTVATALGAAKANDLIRRSLGSDPNIAEAIVRMKTIELLSEKWNGTMPNALGGNSILSISGQDSRSDKK